MNGPYFGQDRGSLVTRKTECCDKDEVLIFWRSVSEVGPSRGNIAILHFLDG